jgi:signal transduction histidine kinase
VNGRKRNGLGNMRKRIEAIGGHFSLVTSPNQGTKITILAPLAKTAEVQ